MKTQYAKMEIADLHSRSDKLPVNFDDESSIVVKVADFEFPVAPECIHASASGNDVEVFVQHCDVEFDGTLAKRLIPAQSDTKDKRILFCLDFSCPDGSWLLGPRLRNVEVSLEGFEPHMFISASDNVALLMFEPEQIWHFTRSWWVKETENSEVVWIGMEQPCYLQHTGREVVLKMGKAEEVGRQVETTKPAGNAEQPRKETNTALVVYKGSKSTKGGPVVHFDDIIGQEEAKSALWEIVRMLKRFDRLQDLDARMPHGVLLLGDAGNGKTMLACAMACESGVAFMKVKASDLISPYPGEGSKNVVKVWEEARKKKSPVIIFMDEIDGVGAKRKSGSDNRNVEVLNAILDEMDGFNNNEYPIIVLGATNRPEVLDPAMLRAGRFDRKVTVRNPKHAEIVRLLQQYTKRKPLDGDIDFEAVAKKIAGLPCSSAANVCNEAALRLFHADETGKLGLRISQEMFLEAAKQEVREHIGTSSAKRFKSTDDAIKLVDVIGQDGAKEDMVDVINYLRNPEIFRAAGASVPSGVLMVGGPGLGKTRLARAVAGEAEVPFFYLSGSDFVEQFVGVGASRVREFFAELRRNAPCIGFIDEIDALAKKRKPEGQGNDEYEQTLNALLVEMDGFDNEGEPVVLLAATNRKDALDPAVIRPGRLEREAVFYSPDVDDRTKLFDYYTRNKKLAKGVKLEFFARNTFGFSAAKVEMVCNEAALLMLRDGATEVTAMHFDRAITRISVGASRKLGNVTEQDLENTRVHEGGHAVVGWFAGRNKIARITIQPFGESLGHVQPMNDDRHCMYKQQMLDTIASLLAGRAATEIVLDEIDAGPSSDFKAARKMAYRMVTEYGMSDLGPIPEIEGLPRSEAEKAAIEAAVNAIVKQEDQRCRSLINEHRLVLDKLVKALRKKETILGPEFEAIMAGKPVRRSRAKVKAKVA
jgi:cell division protease FtsH